jgi:hypothetical protein
VSTLVVYADVSDGYIQSNSGDQFAGPQGVYADARAGTGLVANTTATALSLGQQMSSDGYDQYTVWEPFLGFDTSALGSATVGSAVLNLTSNSDGSSVDFTVQARLCDWGATLTTADWVAGGSLSGLTLLGSYDTSGGFVPGTAYDFSDTAMAANVNKAGTTRMLLCSSRTVSNNVPAGPSEWINPRAADYTGTTSDPKLTVTYSAGVSAPTRVQSATLGNGQANPCSLPQPATAGNLLIAFSTYNPYNLTMTGWTVGGQYSYNGQYLYWWWKIASGGEQSYDLNAYSALVEYVLPGAYAAAHDGYGQTFPSWGEGTSRDVAYGSGPQLILGIGYCGNSQGQTYARDDTAPVVSPVTFAKSAYNNGGTISLADYLTVGASGVEGGWQWPLITYGQNGGICATISFGGPPSEAGSAHVILGGGL